MENTSLKNIVFLINTIVIYSDNFPLVSGIDCFSDLTMLIDNNILCIPILGMVPLILEWNNKC